MLNVSGSRCQRCMRAISFYDLPDETPQTSSIVCPRMAWQTLRKLPCLLSTGSAKIGESYLRLQCQNVPYPGSSSAAEELVVLVRVDYSHAQTWRVWQHALSVQFSAQSAVSSGRCKRLIGRGLHVLCLTCRIVILRTGYKFQSAY